MKIIELAAHRVPHHMPGRHCWNGYIMLDTGATLEVAIDGTTDGTTTALAARRLMEQVGLSAAAACRLTPHWRIEKDDYDETSATLPAAALELAESLGMLTD